jgi:hypothetical protein
MKKTQNIIGIVAAISLLIAAGVIASSTIAFQNAHAVTDKAKSGSASASASASGSSSSSSASAGKCSVSVTSSGDIKINC